MSQRPKRLGHSNPAFGPTRWLLAFGVALALFGCAISPKPEPPEVSFDLGGVRADQITAGIGDLDLVGGPGSAKPPGAKVRAFSLEATKLPEEATVTADGGFILPGIATAGQEVRLQLVTDTERSEPVDIVMGARGEQCAPAIRPLASCLTLVPPKELDLASASSITVRSNCTSAVTLTAPRSRRTLPELALGANVTWPATLVAGDELTIEVQLNAPAGFDEEIFFIEATSPSTDRRPITIRPSP